MLDLRTGRRWLPAPLTVAGLVVLAACGGGDSTAPATDTTTTASASADAFAQCMTEQGVPAPEGGTRITGPGGGEPGKPDGQQGGPVTRRNAPPAPDGVAPEAWDAALKTCGHLGVRRTNAPGEGGS